MTKEWRKYYEEQLERFRQIAFENIIKQKEEELKKLDEDKQ